jgi:fimbrial isopeptide formation D2 family protein/LPXTG-motif cell wall-anchored protein
LKQFKSLVALVLAVVMVVATMGVAFASAPDISDTNGTFDYSDTVLHDSTTSSLKVKNTGSIAHSFTLYQLFVGDVTQGATSGSAVFSNITWGNGVKDAETNYGDATAKAKTITTAALAKAFADTLIEDGNLQNGVAKSNIAANADAEWTGLNPGYYLVLDTTEGLGDGEDTDSYSAYIMQVVGAVERNAKISIPTVTKKVGDVNDSTGTTQALQNSADYDVGDKVPFTITGTLPSNYGEYETYKAYNFTDTLSDGLTPPASADDIEVKIGDTSIKDNFNIAINGQTITITLKADKDMKTIAPLGTEQIVVTYEATLNDNAVMGNTGNPNTVDLVFSNNPNQGGDGDTGKTTDTVLVFTFKVEVNKVTGMTAEEAGTALAGAAFSLYKKYATVPEGKTAATSITYDNGKKTYTIADGVHWVLVGSTTAGTATTFDFERIDDGEYLLVETVTPDGYNSIEPKTFTVTAVHDEELTSVSGTGTINLGTITNNVGVDTNINNEGGITLPTTGGIGTTIFYVAGIVLVLGAAAIIIARRKAEQN